MISRNHPAVTPLLMLGLLAFMVVHAACVRPDPSAEPEAAEPAATPEAPEPGTPEPGTPEPGTPEPAPEPEPEPLTLTAWDLQEDVGEILPGGDVPWVWGFQGGAMIRPVIWIEASTGFEPGEDVNLVFDHQPVNATDPYVVDEIFEHTEYIATIETDATGAMVIGPIDDQLAWVSATGTHLTLEVTVRSETGSISHTVSREIWLVDAAPLPEQPCDRFSDEAPGCAYAWLPGEVAFTSVQSTVPTGDCTDPIAADGTFVPRESIRAGIEACHESSIGYTPGAFDEPRRTDHVLMERECAERNGVVVGGRMDAEFVVEASGTCNPTPRLVWGAELSACHCL